MLQYGTNNGALGKGGNCKGKGSKGAAVLRGNGANMARTPVIILREVAIVIVGALYRLQAHPCSGTGTKIAPKYSLRESIFLRICGAPCAPLLITIQSSVHLRYTPLARELPKRATAGQPVG